MTAQEMWRELKHEVRDVLYLFFLPLIYSFKLIRRFFKKAASRSN